MKSTRLLESSALMILLSLGAISNPGTAHGQVFSPLFIDHIPLEDPSLTAEARLRIEELSTDRSLDPLGIVRVATPVLPTSDGFLVDMPDTTRVELEMTTASRDPHGRVRWVGHNTSRGVVGALVEGPDGVTATFRFRDRTYVLIPITGDLHFVGLAPSDFVIGECGMQPTTPVTLSSEEGTLQLEPMTTDGGICPPIGVMVVYTSWAETWIASMTPDIQIDEALKNAFDDINSRVYSDSNIQAELNLVYTHMITSQESADLSNDLAGLVDPADEFAEEVHGLRNQHAADVVVLLGWYLNGEGRAQALMATEDTAFAVVSALVYGEHNPAVDISPLALSMAHEIGHLQGAAHSILNTTDPFPYGHAYCFSAVGADYGTVMSRKHDCGDDTERIPYFSNPEVAYPPGDPAAVSIGTVSERDNARVLNETRCTVAGFRRATVKISPNPRGLVKGEREEITISVTVHDEPIRGAVVSIGSSDSSLISVPATATTDEAGVAAVTVESVGDTGTANLTASSKGGTDQISVTVYSSRTVWKILALLGAVVVSYIVVRMVILWSEPD